MENYKMESFLLDWIFPFSDLLCMCAGAHYSICQWCVYVSGGLSLNWDDAEARAITPLSSLCVRFDILFVDIVPLRKPRSPSLRIRTQTALQSSALIKWWTICVFVCAMSTARSIEPAGWIFRSKPCIFYGDQSFPADMKLPLKLFNFLNFIFILLFFSVVPIKC